MPTCSRIARRWGGRGLQRVGGPDDLAGGGDRLVPVEHHRHQRPTGDEVDQLPEERLVLVLGVVLLRQVAVDGHVLHGDDR